MGAIEELPWDHAYVAGPDNICQTCGWVGSYAHTEEFYRKYGPRFERRIEYDRLILKEPAALSGNPETESER